MARVCTRDRRKFISQIDFCSKRPTNSLEQIVKPDFQIKAEYQNGPR